MKIIKVPYRKNVQSILDSIITVIAICGVAFMIWAIIEWDWKAFLIVGAITVPTSVYLWKTMTGQILIWTKDFITIKIINDVNDTGFSLNHNQKETRIKWKDIQSLELENENNLIINLNTGKKVIVDNEYARWYFLLKSIPKSKLKSSLIPDFLTKAFVGLETCLVCGSIALNSEKCLSCGSACFNNDLKKEFGNESEYIKSEQLELFCTSDERESVDFFPDEKDGFDRDAKWKPMVTEEDVIVYSKLNYWESIKEKKWNNGQA